MRRAPSLFHNIHSFGPTTAQVTPYQARVQTYELLPTAQSPTLRPTPTRQLYPPPLPARIKNAAFQTWRRTIIMTSMVTPCRCRLRPRSWRSLRFIRMCARLSRGEMLSAHTLRAGQWLTPHMALLLLSIMRALAAGGTSMPLLCLAIMMASAVRGTNMPLLLLHITKIASAVEGTNISLLGHTIKMGPTVQDTSSKPAAPQTPRAPTTASIQPSRPMTHTPPRPKPSTTIPSPLAMAISASSSTTRIPSQFATCTLS
jgi:hypothetical protein